MTEGLPNETQELERGKRLATLSIVFAGLGFCLFPFAFAAIIQGVRALSKGRAKSGSSAQIMAITALCLAPFSGLSGIGGCSAVAIPAFIAYMRHSKTKEAVENVAALHDAVVAHHARSGSLPDGLGPTPTEPPCGVRQPWPADAAPGWAALGFRPADPLAFSYEIEVSGDRQGFVVRARGDLDCDRIYSRFERSGVIERGAIRSQMEPLIQNDPGGSATPGTE
jgi:hypothetical protein